MAEETAEELIQRALVAVEDIPTHVEVVPAVIDYIERYLSLQPGISTYLVGRALNRVRILFTPPA
jgi:hypothetical protein